MPEKRVECTTVVIPDLMRVGTFANALRIIHDSGSEFFLDFLQYSESENMAHVVARLRVQEGFLAAIRDRLSVTVTEIQDTKENMVSVVPMNSGDKPN